MKWKHARPALESPRQPIATQTHRCSCPLKRGLQVCGAATDRRRPDTRFTGPESVNKVLNVLKWRDQLFVQTAYDWTEFNYPPRTCTRSLKIALTSGCPGAAKLRTNEANRLSALSSRFQNSSFQLAYGLLNSLANSVDNGARSSTRGRRSETGFGGGSGFKANEEQENARFGADTLGGRFPSDNPGLLECGFAAMALAARDGRRCVCPALSARRQLHRAAAVEPADHRGNRDEGAKGRPRLGPAHVPHRSETPRRLDGPRRRAPLALPGRAY